MNKIFTLLLTVCSFTMYAQLNQSLVAHWELNGNTIDISGNSYDGSIVGDGISPATNRFGSSGCAMKTTSAISYIDIPKTITIDSTKGFSISLWYKLIPVDPNTNYNDGGYYDIKTSAVLLNQLNPAFSMNKLEEEMNSPIKSNSCSLWVNNQQFTVFQDCETKWNHIVLIAQAPMVNNYKYKFYKNNVGLQTSQDLNSTVHNKLKISLANTSLYKVMDNVNNKSVDVTSQSHFEYYFDEVRLYNKELSVSEIDQLYKETNTCTVTALDKEVINQTIAKKVMKAVNFLGQEITDINSYSGPGILIYSDGTREKIIKR